MFFKNGECRTATLVATAGLRGVFVMILRSQGGFCYDSAQSGRFFLSYLLVAFEVSQLVNKSICRNIVILELQYKNKNIENR